MIYLIYIIVLAVPYLNYISYKKYYAYMSAYMPTLIQIYRMNWVIPNGYTHIC